MSRKVVERVVVDKGLSPWLYLLFTESSIAVNEKLILCNEWMSPFFEN